MYSYEKRAAAARARAAGKAAAAHVANVHLAEHVADLRRIGRLPDGVTSIGPAGKGAARNEWRAELSGPANTPYEGGTFTIGLRFEAPYPMKPPRVWFLKPIYHPQVDEGGAVALDVLSSRWLPSIRPWHIVHALHLMLRQPGESHLVRCCTLEAERAVRFSPTTQSTYRAWLFERERHRHDDLARLWTHRFASTASTAPHFVPSLFALAAAALGCEKACGHGGCTLAEVPESLWAATNDAREEQGYTALGARPPMRTSAGLQVPCRPFVPCRRHGLANDIDGEHRCTWSADGFTRRCVDCTGDGPAPRRAEDAALLAL